MLTKISTGTVIGLDGILIDVEVDVAGRGFPTFTIVGLPNKSIDEAKDRVRTAIVNAGFEMPDSRLTVNLAPADLPKSGSAFDLPIALGILSSCGHIPSKNIAGIVVIGELSLEGEVRKVPGILPLTIAAKENRFDRIFVPAANAAEAAIVSDVTVYPVNNLRQLIQHLLGSKAIAVQPKTILDNLFGGNEIFNMSDIRGQYQAKRALEIAAAGFHNTHLKGVPGAGKTMLSRSFPSILPPLETDEILEVSKIYSIAGLLKSKPYISTRPFRSPHHTTSRMGLIGGGSNPNPGEISLAHRGVLFLDEFPEFPRIVLEALRQPLEDGIVTISRASGSLTFPARFLLLSASNPCPCGYLGHPTKKCSCMPGSIIKYKKRLSGPLIDRIDLHVSVSPVDERFLINENGADTSQIIRKRVIAARERQTNRFHGLNIFTNSEMGPQDVKKFCKISDGASEMLKKAISALSLSARSYFKLIKTAQTIADLAASDVILESHLAESLQYRPID